MTVACVTESPIGSVAIASPLHPRGPRWTVGVVSQGAWLPAITLFDNYQSEISGAAHIQDSFKEILLLLPNFERLGPVQ